MSGFGALDFMNKTISNNRKLIKKYSAFVGLKERNKALEGKVARFSEGSSEADVNRLLQKIKDEDRKATRIKIVKSLLALVLICALLALFIAGVVSKGS